MTRKQQSSYGWWPGDAGETLIEILIAVVVIALIFVGVLGAMGTNLIASRVHRNQADVTSVLLSAAERVKSSPYVACAAGNPASPITNSANPYLAAAQSAATAVGWAPAQVSIPTVTYEFRDNTGTNLNSLTCYNVSGLTLQLVTVEVSSPSGSFTQTISVVKRNPA